MKKQRLSKTFFFNMLSLILLAAVLFAYFWISYEYQRFDEESILLREEYLKRQKAVLRSEVNNALNYLQYHRQFAEERYQADLRARVDEAYHIAHHLYAQYHEQMPPKALRQLIKETLRPIRFNDGRGYYFAVDLDGTEVLFADQPQLEGQNFLEHPDPQVREVIQDMIAIAQNPGEGFYRYVWTKPESEGRQHRKLAYLKYFEPCNWVLGTGEYLDDIRRSIQQEVIERLVQIRFGKEGYIFGSTYEGAPLFTNGEITFGTDNLWELTDPNGTKITQVERELVNNPEGGFMSYSWYKLDNPEPSPKISFIKGDLEWRWMIGAGVYIDEIEEMIAEERQALTQRVRRNLMQSALILFVLLVCLGALVSYLSHKVHTNFQAFSSFFSTAATRSVRIDRQALHFEEFDRLAAAANRMIDERRVLDGERRKAEEALEEYSDRLEEMIGERTAQLEQAQEQLIQQEKLALVGQLANGVGHELRNPLGIISNAVYYLQLVLPQTEESIREYLDIIKAGVTQCSQIISNLLDFARMKTLEKTPLHMVQVVKQVLTQQVVPEDIHVAIEFPADLPMIFVDLLQLEKVLTNLFTNAFQAMPDGGTLTMTAEVQQVQQAEPTSMVALHLADSGNGISEEDVAKIFEPLFTNKAKGIGLGLTICKNLIEANGGAIQVCSQEGKGSKFTVLLPTVPEGLEKDDGGNAHE